MNISAAELTDHVQRILVAAGARAEDARLVARNLVESNLVGHDSHGIMRLPRYVQAIRGNEIDVTVKPSVVKDNDVVTLIDGAWGFGQCAATLAMDKSIAKARSHGVACASIFNCNDIGRLGAYSIRAVEHDCIGMVMNNDGGSTPLVAPWCGTKALLSTNPLSLAAPCGDRPPLCIDMSTSVTAGSKVHLAQQRREQVPEGCLIDAAGNPTTDPNVLFTEPLGALLPLGSPVAGHKGFALSLGIDILGGALSGAGCSGVPVRDAQGVFVQVIDIASFTSVDGFIEQVSGLLDRVKAVSPVDGVDEIRIPGEHIVRIRSQRLRDGIYIEDKTWSQIMDAAATVGIDG